MHSPLNVKNIFFIMQEYNRQLQRQNFMWYLPHCIRYD